MEPFGAACAETSPSPFPILPWTGAGEWGDLQRTRLRLRARCPRPAPTTSSHSRRGAPNSRWTRRYSSSLQLLAHRRAGSRLLLSRLVDRHWNFGVSHHLIKLIAMLICNAQREHTAERLRQPIGITRKHRMGRAAFRSTRLRGDHFGCQSFLSRCRAGLGARFPGRAS